MNMVDASEYGFCLMKFDNDQKNEVITEKYNNYNISDFAHIGDSGSIIIKIDNTQIISKEPYASSQFLTFCYDIFNMKYEEGLEYVKLFSFESSIIIDNTDYTFIMNGSGWNEDYKFMFDIGHNEELLTYIKLKYPNIQGHTVKSRHA